MTKPRRRVIISREASIVWFISAGPGCVGLKCGKGSSLSRARRTCCTDGSTKGFGSELKALVFISRRSLNYFCSFDSFLYGDENSLRSLGVLLTRSWRRSTWLCKSICTLFAAYCMIYTCSIEPSMTRRSTTAAFSWRDISRRATPGLFVCRAPLNFFLM